MGTAKQEPCPACGGAGGGPFGRSNAGWDIETYECTRCEGWGYLREAPPAEGAGPASRDRPGIAKTVAPPQTGEEGSTETKRTSAR